MKKNNKIGIIGAVLGSIMTISSGLGYTTADAAESTAAIKGFNVDGLTYIDDQLSDNVVMETEKYRYGEFSMWSACYKNVVTNSNGSQTCYYFVLVESSIDSQGNKDIQGNTIKNRWFRNKNLNVSIDFYSPKGGVLELYTPEQEGLSSYITYGFDESSELEASSDSLGVEFSESVTCTYTTVYSEVILTTSYTNTVSNHQIVDYKYHFSNYDDGAMVSPNIHLVTKRMMAVFSVPNYTSNDAYEINVTTHAEIFKDAKWPLENYTFEKERTHTYRK